MFGFINKSLRRKLVLAAVLVEVALLSILVWNSVRIAERHLVAETENRINELLPLLNGSMSGPVLDYDLASLQELLAQIVWEPAVRYIEVYGNDGRIITRYGRAVAATVQLTEPDHKVDLSNIELGSTIQIDSPVTVATRQVGRMRIQLNTSFFVQAVHSLRGQGFLIAALEVLLSIFLLTLIAAGLTRQLTALTQASRKLARGDFSARVDERGQDEVALLAHTFNDMASTRARVETALKSLARGGMDGSHEQFFYEAVKTLSQAFGARYAFIGLTDEPINHKVRTIVAVDNGHQVANFEYDLKDTPCSDCLARHKTTVTRDADKLYPDDRLLQDMELESYFGVALKNSNDEKIGLVVVAHTEPLEAEPWMEALLEVFTARIELEIERSKADAAMQRMAYQDALTDLANRHEFDTRLTRAIDSARTRNLEHCVLYLDLDQFKIINDTCGHAAGDEMLRQVAKLLHGPVRERDTVARLGGDEFGLLLENCPSERGQAIAQRLINAIGDFRFVWEDKLFAVGASVGIVSIDNDSVDANELLRAADMACYAAKDLGRNRYHVYHAEDADLARREGEMRWVSDIHDALDKDRFVMFRQPIVSLNETGAPQDVNEHLVRMFGQDGESILPGSFIPAAERYNLMPAVDRWVIGEVLAHAATGAQPKDLSMPDLFINLSGTTLNDATLPAYVREKLSQHTVDPRRLCFEVTETAAMANLAQALKFIEQIKVLGCRFALDDFGSGLSSFSYLKTLPVDFIKIDGGFVRNMLNDPMDSAIVETIHQIGQTVGIQTIAEFVEDDATRERLREIGIDYAQGYGIARPEPMVELARAAS